MTKEQYAILDLLKKWTYTPFNPNCWVGFNSFSCLKAMNDLMDVYPSCVQEKWIETSDVCGTVSIRVSESGIKAMEAFTLLSAHNRIEDILAHKKIDLGD